MTTIISVIQILLSVLLIALILMQQSDAGLGSAFGTDDGGLHRTRRGAERVLFIATIVVVALFVISAVIALLVH
jgi:preprotein translocase subunit SecG